MDKKSTPPKRGNKDTSNNSTIKLTPTQQLALEYILKHPDCNRWQLGLILKPGKKTHIGLYSIRANSIKKAHKALGW